MNKERIEHIINWLETGAIHVDENGEKYGFDMDYWHSNFEEEGIETPPTDLPEDCGTAMCIGGAAEQFFGADVTAEEYEAASLLGLPYDLADRLFYPWYVEDYREAGSPKLTPEYMAGVLRRLLDTGELVW